MFVSRKGLPFIGALAAIGLLAIGAPMLRAQAVSIASVTGRVTDPSGAVLAGARSWIRNGHRVVSECRHPETK